MPLVPFTSLLRKASIQQNQWCIGNNINACACVYSVCSYGSTEMIVSSPYKEGGGGGGGGSD